MSINWGTVKNYKNITSKNLIYSTENSIQYSVMTYMGKESKTKEGICVYVFT